MQINSYPSIYAIGHKAISNIFSSPVVVEEKVDGSQISFGVIDGELFIRSKRARIYTENPEGMFKKAVEYIVSIQDNLVPGWSYRGEYLQKPKHNALKYNRVPTNNIMIFDIDNGFQEYIMPWQKIDEASKIGLECVPLLLWSVIEKPEKLFDLLERESVLGGTKIEGVVVKNYNIFTQEKKIAIGKYVSEAFKEVASDQWKKANPGHNDIINALIESYATEARWQKAVQHLRDDGTLLGEPKDIGPLMRELQIDVEKECEDEIKDILYKQFRKQILRGVGRGFPEWYKKQLAEGAFE